MYKYFLLIALILCSFSVSAQWQQTGSKVRYVNGLGIPTKDTAAGVLADSSQILIRPADSSLYVKYKRTWQKVGSGGTIGGSGTTNRVPKFTGATTLGNSSIVDSSASIAMTINTSGSVGISTTSPAAKLDVNGSFRTSGIGANVNPISAGTNQNYLRFLSSGADFYVGTESSVAGAFFTGSNAYDNVLYGNSTAINLINNGVSRIYVASGGNIGIGYTTPAAKLSVAGTTLINTNTDNGVDKLQVSGGAIATRLKVNTSGQTLNISTYYNGGFGNNLWINNTEPPVTSAGYSNIAIGFEALINNTSGYTNTAIGQSALNLNTSGYDNFALGASSLASNTTGYQNVSIGFNSLVNNTSGNNNIALGRESGRYTNGAGSNQTSNTSIYIGTDTRSSANGNSNEIVIGHTNIGQGSNTVTLGNSSITKTFLRGSTMVNTTSDNGVDKLQVNGSISGIGMKQAYVTKTGAYTATDADYVIDCTSGTFTVTLPASSGRTGRILIIKNSGAGSITVDGNAAETIDGAATYSLAVQYATVQIMSDGTNWKIISKF